MFNIGVTRPYALGHSIVVNLLSLVLALFLCSDFALFSHANERANLDRDAKVAPVPAKRVQLPQVPLAVALETRGDLNLQDTEMAKALYTIGVSWKVNIVFGNDMQGRIGCNYKDTPLREVLDAILLANGYSYRAVGESLVVQKSEEVGPANPLFQSAFIPITHSNLDEIVEGATLLKSAQGEVRALPSARSLMVIDYADQVAVVRNFAEQMEAAAKKASGGIPTEAFNRLDVAYFHTQYIAVDDAKLPLDAVMSQVGRVATMPEENRLVVVDYASNIEMVKKVLAKIDQPRPQVRIKALIYDISLQDVEQLGFNWNSAVKGRDLDADGNPKQAVSLNSQTILPFAAGANGGTFTIKSLTTYFDINSVALLLQNANDARLLADPHVTVQENSIADVSSVREIPFQQITQSELGGQIGTTAFKKVGIMLKVVPTVAADGTVKMDIEQEFSRVVGFTEGDSQPIIDSRTANTTVRVANRHTLVIGGLRQRSDTGEFNGIPFLKDVRYIGPLFRSRETNVRESELVIFIMPEVINYDQPPKPREYMAQETINCRLDRVPMAEGCVNPSSLNGSNGANCEKCDENSFPGEQPMQLPEVGNDSLTFPGQGTSNNQDATSGNDQQPFRTSFEQRHRSPGGTAERLNRINKTSSKQAEPYKAKSTTLSRLFGS